MSARATRGPRLGVGAADCFTILPGPGDLAGEPEVVASFNAPWRANHRRKDSSEMETPIDRSDSTNIRTEVPRPRSFKRTDRYGSKSPVLVAFLLFASAINLASAWEFDGESFGFIQVKFGNQMGNANGKCGT